MQNEGILYVTDRATASTDKHFYKNKRGDLLCLGAGKIKVGNEGSTWEEPRRISLSRPALNPQKAVNDRPGSIQGIMDNWRLSGNSCSDKSRKNK
ncbi:MAG: hypothetical protein JRF45_08025 [Deltaproteobacteria bacterium]|jgi:hypothetical protein|nr:hypothetical protein [Deltaproteobacteria bacterium]MBW1747409.1 hypothetical protein [Deltaproteobacteria bacterium]MBW1826726.1 hypothetical protein [Deltaproteobacteria bacterium]MBW1968960.1 hypothetical protein [Deltaproteobacteria bacterium]MBW2157091.1 hypothetical protein [Deltaproteobacteria bacterium]